MGTRGQDIVGEHRDRVLELLNKAFADEWLAYYQYWIGAKIIAGPMRDAVEAELIQHATEELNHGDMVAERIIQLGGTPLLEPRLWYDHTNCGYDTPSDPHVSKLLEQNIAAEQCAISVYDSLIKETREYDPVTSNLALQILEQEVEHEEDLQSLQEDVQLLMAKQG